MKRRQLKMILTLAWTACLLCFGRLCAQDSMGCPAYIVTFNDGYGFSKVGKDFLSEKKGMKSGAVMSFKAVRLWPHKGSAALGTGMVYSYGRTDIKHGEVQMPDPALHRISAHYVAPQIVGAYRLNGYLLLDLNAGIGYTRLKGKEEYRNEKGMLYSNGLAFNVAARFSSLVTKHFGFSLEANYLKDIYSKIQQGSFGMDNLPDDPTGLISMRVDALFGIFLYF